MTELEEYIIGKRFMNKSKLACALRKLTEDEIYSLFQFAIPREQLSKLSAQQIDKLIHKIHKPEYCTYLLQLNVDRPYLIQQICTSPTVAYDSWKNSLFISDKERLRLFKNALPSWRLVNILNMHILSDEREILIQFLITNKKNEIIEKILNKQYTALDLDIHEEQLLRAAYMLKILKEA
jgi:hypothetical protein